MTERSEMQASDSEIRRQRIEATQRFLFTKLNMAGVLEMLSAHAGKIHYAPLEGEEKQPWETRISRPGDSDFAPEVLQMTFTQTSDDSESPLQRKVLVEFGEKLKISGSETKYHGLLLKDEGTLNMIEEAIGEAFTKPQFSDAPAEKGER